MNIIIPMAGNGKRFLDKGFGPKPLIDIHGKPMFVVACDNLINIMNNEFSQIIFIINQWSSKMYGLNFIINHFYPTAKVIILDDITEGAACTVQAAKTYLPLNEPVMTINCDQVISLYPNSLEEWKKRKKEFGAGIMIFHNPERDPKWSFVEISEGMIINVKEKEPISNWATVGYYYWKKAIDMFNSIDQMILNNERVNNEFYIAPAYNYYIKNGGQVFPFKIKQIHGLGTPEDVKKYLTI